MMRFVACTVRMTEPCGLVNRAASPPSKPSFAASAAFMNTGLEMAS